MAEQAQVMNGKAAAGASAESERWVAGLPAAARHAGCSVSTLQRAVKSGDVETREAGEGGAKLFARADLEAIRDARGEAAPPTDAAALAGAGVKLVQLAQAQVRELLPLVTDAHDRVGTQIEKLLDRLLAENASLRARNADLEGRLMATVEARESALSQEHDRALARRELEARMVREEQAEARKARMREAAWRRAEQMFPFILAKLAGVTLPFGGRATERTPEQSSPTTSGDASPGVGSEASRTPAGDTSAGDPPAHLRRVLEMFANLSEEQIKALSTFLGSEDIDALRAVRDDLRGEGP